MVDLREIKERHQIDSIALIPSTLQELGNLLKLGCYKPATLPKQVSYTAGAMLWKTGFLSPKSLSIFNFFPQNEILFTYCSSSVPKVKK